MHTLLLDVRHANVGRRPPTGVESVNLCMRVTVSFLVMMYRVLEQLLRRLG